MSGNMDMKRTSDLEGLDTKQQFEDTNGTVSEGYADGPIVRDEVFGDISGKGPNYRNLGWMRASVLMVKLQIGLGVLSIPGVFHTLGIVPGVIVILIIAIMTTWSDYVVGMFKIRHPHVYTLADVGQMLFGPIGREVFGFGYWLLVTGIAGASLLSFSIALNAISEHAVCTVVFVVVGAIIVAGLSSIRTLGKVAFLAWIGLASILGAVLTLAIAVSQQDRPSAAPSSGPWDKDIRVVGDATFLEGISAVSNVVFSYAGTATFFNVVSEMRDPKKDYAKALFTCQGLVTLVYLVIGGVVYHYAGQYVSSPALGSAGPLLKKVCYGIAIPGLLVGATLNTHTPAKYVLVRVLKGTKHLSQSTPTHWITWLSIVAAQSTIATIIALAVPFFGSLLGLFGALVGTLTCMIIMSMMWYFDHWRDARTTAWKAQAAWAMAVGVIGCFLLVAGTYASVIDIRNSLNAGTAGSFSCADNSGS